MNITPIYLCIFLLFFIFSIYIWVRQIECGSLQIRLIRKVIGRSSPYSTQLNYYWCYVRFLLLELSINYEQSGRTVINNTLRSNYRMIFVRSQARGYRAIAQSTLQSKNRLPTHGTVCSCPRLQPESPPQLTGCCNWLPVGYFRSVYQLQNLLMYNELRGMQDRRLCGLPYDVARR